MNDFAIIDIGSNSVRLMRVADGKVLYKRLKTTRLGEGLAESPRLKETAIVRTAEAVAAFVEETKREGAGNVYAFAPAAVRSAENREEFLSRVDKLCGLKIEVVSGEEEAELGILGALGGADGCVIDAGGASTEIVVQKDGQTVYKKSVNIGVVRLKDTCGRELARLKAAAEKAAREYGAVPTGVPVYAIGGTATTLAAIKLGLEVYDSAKITGTVLSHNELEEMSDRLAGMSVEEIANTKGVAQNRADIIGGGAVLLSTLAKTLGFEKITVSDSDNLEGYAKKRGLMK